MAVERNPLQVVREARQIAADYGLLVIEKGSVFYVFRKTLTVNVPVAHTRTAKGLDRAVRRITGFK